MTKRSQSPSPAAAPLLLALIFLMFLTFTTAVRIQGSKSRLVQGKTMRHQLMAVRGGANPARNSLNAVSVSGGGADNNVKSQPAVCSRLQRIRHYCPPFPALSTPPAPPSPSDYEIDPRYGVQKRLVPSGPNPLHN